MGKTEGATSSKGNQQKMNKLLKKYIPRKILGLFTKKSLFSKTVIYNIANAKVAKLTKLLGDGGANGMIADGKTYQVIWWNPIKKVDITDNDNHQMRNIRLYTVYFVAETQVGEVIFIVHNATFVDHGHIILSWIQMQAHGCDFDNRLVKAEIPGKQAITSTHGHMICLEIEDGLLYFNRRPSAHDKWLESPHVELTSAGDWDPSILNHKLSVDEMKHGSKVPIPTDPVVHPDYNIEGELVNDAIEVNQLDLDPGMDPQDTCSPILEYNIHLYAVEGFTRDKIPISNDNITMAYNRESGHQSSINSRPEYTTSVVNRVILRRCSTGFVDRLRHYKQHINTLETE